MNLQFEFKRYRNTFALLLLFIGAVSTSANAQRRSEEEIKKIQDAKVAIITNRLNLTPEQSTGFWPMYNE